jgi:hypothetical protein
MLHNVVSSTIESIFMFLSFIDSTIRSKRINFIFVFLPANTTLNILVNLIKAGNN